MKCDRTVYVLRIRAGKDVDETRALRRLLKAMLRQIGWQCLSVEVEVRE